MPTIKAHIPRKIVAMFDGDGTLLDTMEHHGRLAADCIVNPHNPIFYKFLE